MDIREWLGEDNQIGYDIWTKKYQHEDESFEEWLDRISGGNEELRKLIKQKKFLFGGRVLANRGIPNTGNYYNCFSAGYVPDDYAGILDKCKEIGMTFKSQGGQGISLSKIRPKGTPIGAQYKSDGIVGFMELFNTVTDKTSQGGARKGALMMSLDAWHKEAEDFITIKSNEDKITKANLSLEIDDEFMDAVRHYYETGEELTFTKIKLYSGHIIEYEVTPIKLYKKMIQMAYDWAEPGCMFIDRIRNYSLLNNDNRYVIATTNPCGEQPLGEQMCCNLGSLNLYEFVNNKFTEDARFDFEKFADAIRIASNALDEIIDENAARLPDFLKPYKENAYNWRNIGLGVFNYAHMLMALNLTYGSTEAWEFTNELFEYMALMAIVYNNTRGVEKGNYPNFKKELYTNSAFMSEHPSLSDNARNATLLSIAPTGSISTMLGGSGGIEPEFQLSYIRKTDNLKESYQIDSQVVKDYKKVHPNKELPACFVVSSDIDWIDRIDTQAIIQKHIDTAISSTINLPNSTTLEEIEQLYLYAWKKGLKGVTIYRDGCKRSGILVTNETQTSKENEHAFALPKRGEVMDIQDDKVIGLKKKLVSGCGSLHCAAYFDVETGDLREIYLSKGSTGGCGNFMTGLSRMISMSARAGVKIHDIVDQLMSTGVCPSYATRTKTKHDTSKGSCCPMAIGYALQEMWEEFNGIKMNTTKTTTERKEIIQEKIKKEEAKNVPLCPDCGAPLTFEGGCNICKECGYSKCD